MPSLTDRRVLFHFNREVLYFYVEHLFSLTVEKMWHSCIAGKAGKRHNSTDSNPYCTCAPMNTKLTDIPLCFAYLDTHWKTPNSHLLQLMWIENSRSYWLYCFWSLNLLSSYLRSWQCVWPWLNNADLYRKIIVVWLSFFIGLEFYESLNRE